jgi:hypothetical protein
MDLHPEFFSSKRRKVISRPETPQVFDSRPVVKVFPELEVYVDVVHPRTKENIRFTGRADWGFGYGGRDGVEHGTFLVAIEAKRREVFSTAEKQLLSYLAILREQRKKAGKTNTAIQGFYSDGYRYCFMSINAEGVVEVSHQFDVLSPEGCKTIFNFIVTILESAMKSSPNVTPTKAVEQREKEIGNFKEEVWSKVYVSYLSSPEIVPEDKQELWDMPELKFGA